MHATRVGGAGRRFFIRKTARSGYTIPVKKMLVTLFILLIAGALILVGCQATRAGYESAPYKAVRSDGKFQVRDYPALTVVETPMGGSRSGDDGSFMRLFRFITGSNEAKEKISMTTPVFMSGSESNATMAFVMPAKLAAIASAQADGWLGKGPGTGTGAVRRAALQRRPQCEEGGRVAGPVEGLDGGAGIENELSSPIYGYFDPPWTPAFLRRNEVMLRTDAGQ